jgi:ankyrin repeat protein
MHFGPQRGQTINANVGGTNEHGLLSLGSDGGGDRLYLVLRDGPHGTAGQVLHHDQETVAYTLVAEGLPAFLRASNDLVERDLNAAFYHGDTVGRIFRFPGLDELHRQLDAGLNPDDPYRDGSKSLFGMALDNRREDLFHALLKSGGDADVALREAAYRIRLELAEVALKRGANPVARGPDGRTLLAWAANARRPRTVALLMRYGARTRVGVEAFDQLVAEVCASTAIDDRKKRQLLEALAIAGA